MISPSSSASGAGRRLAAARLRRGATSWLLRAAALLALLGGTGPLWPDTALIGTFGRMFDSLAPQMLALGLALALAAALLTPPRCRGAGRTRLLALLLIAANLAGGAGLALRHRALILAAETTPGRTPASPPAAVAPRTTLDVLWMNLFLYNDTPPEVLEQAILGSGADLVVFGESAPLRPILDALARVYPYRLGCAAKDCEITVLSRRPFGPDSDGFLPSARPERLAMLRIPPPAGAPWGTQPLTLIAAHMAKPWFYGFLDRDRWFIRDRALRAEGPVLLLGDFNAADWSLAMRRLMRETHLAPPALPVATWPVWARGLGVPIDHMLVGGGARLEDLRPWGADLGSNHRGLRARLVWPG